MQESNKSRGLEQRFIKCNCGLREGIAIKYRFSRSVDESKSWRAAEPGIDHYSQGQSEITLGR